MRDLKTIHPTIQRKVGVILARIEQFNTLEEIPNVKRLTGYNNAYRLRIGDYRLGFHMEKDAQEQTLIVFDRVGKRGDFYRIFP